LGVLLIWLESPYWVGFHESRFEKKIRPNVWEIFEFQVVFSFKKNSIKLQKKIKLVL
jgi:hypothetical protein